MARKVALNLDWLPRDENQEADDLSDVKTSDFDEPSGSEWRPRT